MSAENTNPFVLPGMGQSGDLAQNPLLASMEMMRQAWQGFADNGGLGQSGMAAPMSLDDLERRIADLRTVENWLRMNLSMLSSSIQGLEVQRATIATLKSFMDAVPGAQAEPGGQSPLEAALGIRPAPKSASAKKAASAGKSASQAGKDSAKSDPDAVPAQAQAWWDMLKGQFDTLAAATAATMQGAEAAKAASRQPGTGRGGASASESAVKSPKPKASPAKRTVRKRAAPGAVRKKAG